MPDQTAVLNDVLGLVLQIQFCAGLVKAVNQFQKSEDGIAGTSGKNFFVHGLDAGLPERATFLARQPAHQIDGATTDTSRRHIDDTFHGGVVVAVENEAQIGQCVFDFEPLVETMAAVNSVRHADPQQGIFQFP